MGVSFKVSKTGARYRPKPPANDGAVVADDEPESKSKESSRKQQVTKKKKVMRSELNLIHLIGYSWLVPGKTWGKLEKWGIGNSGYWISAGFCVKKLRFLVLMCVLVCVYRISCFKLSWVFIYKLMGIVETEIWDMNLLSFDCWHFLGWTIEVCVINWESVLILRK